MGTVYLCYGQKGSLIMSDTHLALAVVFDVPEGQDFKSYFPKFYATVKGGTKDCLYYGFATCGSKVLCREGYKGAPGLLAHMGEVKGELEGMIKQLGKERVKIIMSGPPAELEKVKPHMDSRLTVKYVELGSPSSTLQPRTAPELLAVCIMDLGLPGIACTAERGTRLLRTVPSMGQM